MSAGKYKKCLCIYILQFYTDAVIYLKENDIFISVGNSLDFVNSYSFVDTSLARNVILVAENKTIFNRRDRDS